MSGSLAKKLGQTLDSLVLGPPVFDETGELPNVVLYPLFPSSLGPDPPDMVTLSEGLRRGVRLSDTGIVSRVHVDNPLSATILAGESDLLIGPTQARSVQFSCLIPPFRRASLPVNCVEEGRPAEHQAEFDKSDTCPWSLRSYKIEQLARHGDVVQYGVWDKIRTYLDTAGTSSNTQGIHDVFDKYGLELSSLRPLFPLKPGQIGAICTVGQNLFFDLFADPELLEDRYDQILKSTLIEAVVHPSSEVVPQDKIEAFLPQLVQATLNSKVMQNRGLQSRGRTLAFSGNGLSGSALLADDQLVHLCAHQQCWGQSRAFSSLLDEMEEERISWDEERPSFLRDLGQAYADRRQRYNSFKAQLSPGLASPNLSDMLQRDNGKNAKKGGPPAPRPLPLNSFLHEFFLNLFRH